MLDREAASPMRRHQVEIFTDQLTIKGAITLPIVRVTDIMNSNDRDFLALDEAYIAPLVLPHQVTGPNRTPTLVRRIQARYVAVEDDPDQGRAPGAEFATVRKVPLPCYGFVGPFVFHAHFHMRPDTALLDTMEIGGAQFLAMTQATVYLIAHPEVPPRQHDVIVVNRAFLDAIYLL